MSTDQPTPQQQADLEKYQAILADKVGTGVVNALHQPERHVLVSFKVFSYLLRRIEQLEAANARP